MPDIIDHAVHATIIADAPESRTIPARLRYKSADPFAVRVIFPSEASLDGTEVHWTFARDLLTEGLRTPAGAGDVRVWPYGAEHTVIEVRAPAGVAMIRFATADLRRFLSSSYMIVPPDSEPHHLDMDTDLASLLREA